MKLKMLIGSPSPRDIDDWRESVEQLPYDIFLAKYYENLEAYVRIRNFFLKHDYDVLCIIPDDLIVHPQGLQYLVDDITKHPNNVFSGYCNIDAMNRKNQFNFRLTTSADYSPYEHELEDCLKKGITKYNKYLYKAIFAGFGCTLIPRKIIEKIPFDDGDELRTDWIFCLDCREKKIDVLLDIRARFYHLAFRVRYGHLENFQVGIKKPEELFLPH